LTRHSSLKLAIISLGLNGGKRLYALFSASSKDQLKIHK